MNSSEASQLIDRFSTPEVAEATGFTQRNVMYLCSLGVVPVAEGGYGRGRGNYRRLDCEGLARVAVTAAFFNAGVEIYLAAKLVAEIGEGTELQDLSNLDHLLGRPHSGLIRWMREQHLDPDNIYYLHGALRKRSNNYAAGVSFPSDRLIEIFDRSFVFLSYLTEPGEAATWPKKPIALFRITGWRKGADTVELHEAGAMPVGKVPAEWAHALRNYKGMTRVNVSLAIRDALDAIADRRGS